MRVLYHPGMLYSDMGRGKTEMFDGMRGWYLPGMSHSVKGRHKRWNMCLDGICSNEPQWMGQDRKNGWCERILFSRNEQVYTETRRVDNGWYEGMGSSRNES